MSNTSFVLISTQRSGSTWVIDLLNSHSRVKAYGELFLVDGDGKPPRGEQDTEFWETYFARQAVNAQEINGKGTLINRYLDRLFSLKSGIDATGFKLMYGQLGAYPEVAEYLRNHKVSIVHLIRRNYLDILLSKDAAVERDMFSADEGQAVPKFQRRVVLPNLIRRLERQEEDLIKGCRLVKALGLECIEIFYEDLISGNQSLREVLEFLHVSDPASSLASRMTKLNKEDHSVIIENYQDLKEGLRGTRFAQFLR